MAKGSSTTDRVPKDIARILRARWPECDSAERWRRVWDFSAVKVDDWLGQPINKKKKK